MAVLGFVGVPDTDRGDCKRRRVDNTSSYFRFTGVISYGGDTKSYQADN